MNRSRRKLPPLTSLRPFEAAARLESFTEAARELGLVQTAVTKQIRRLEEDLGTKLFERKNRAVYVTPQGERFAKVVSEALGNIAAEAASLRGETRSGEVVLRCQLIEAFYWLMPRLAKFHEAHPDVGFNLITALAPLTEANEQFDVAIQTTGRPSGTARLLFTAEDEIFPVCSPNMVREPESLSAEEILSYPLLAHDVTPQDWMDWQGWFEAVGVPGALPATTRKFDSYPVALQAAASGQGIGLGWRRTAEHLINKGELIRPCKVSVPRPTELSVFAPASSLPSKEAELLIKWLATELGAHNTTTSKPA